ncbi:MAG: hypothetical protein ACTHU0_32120 [Kofleriaceae bacterium]
MQCFAWMVQHRVAVSVAAALGLVACGDPSQPGLEDLVDGGVDAGPPVAELPASIDLGAGDCGGTAAGAFTLANRGGSPLTYAFEPLDPRLAIAPASGTVPAGGAVEVRLSVPVPAEVAAGERLAASFRAITNAGDRAPRTIAVAFQSRGAAIAIDPPLVGLGQARVGFPAARSFTVRNIGNAAAPVVIGAPGGEFGRTFGPAGVVALAPGEAAHGEITYTPRDLGADTRAAVVTVTGPHCGALPPSLELAGEGVAGDDSAVLVEGGPVNFGGVTCGSGGTAPIRLVNTSAIPVPFSAVFLSDPELDHLAFAVSQQSGTVPARGTLTLRVHRLPIAFPSGPRAYAAVLRITTTLGVDTVTDVPVRQVLQTAQLAVTGSRDFGVIPVGTTEGLRVNITNTGNAVASLQATTTPGFGAILPLPILPGETRVGWISYTPASATPVIGRVSLSALGACQAPLPLDYFAGHGPFADVAPVTVTVPCPAPAAVTTRLDVINLGTVPLEISCRELDAGGLGASGLAPQFSPAVLRIPPRSAGAFSVELAPGPRTPGAVTAKIECTDNEPLLRTRLTTLTRMLVEPEPGACEP